MSRLRYCSRSSSSRQTAKGMALVLAKLANKEIGDFERNLLRARAILLPDIVVIRSCGITTVTHHVASENKIATSANTHELIRGPLSDDWLSWPPEALELYGEENGFLHPNEPSAQENSNECIEQDNNN